MEGPSATTHGKEVIMIAALLAYPPSVQPTQAPPPDGTAFTGPGIDVPLWAMAAIALFVAGMIASAIAARRESR
jgi:hypothetical protein